VHWVDHEGVRLPKRLGGHPALDFCNTWAGWGEPPSPRREWLPSYDTLAAWTGYAGLLTEPEVRRLRDLASARPEAARRALADARRLRTLLHTAALDPSDERALAGVTGFVRRAHAHGSLRTSGPGGARWVLSPEGGLDLPVLTVALAAAQLLTSPEAATVSACPGRDCGWLFLDRRGRRRWCSMDSCGNRAKVAAHARRQRSRGTG
jgi:predicted RNA-binding Zn ribbon-like protein